MNTKKYIFVSYRSIYRKRATKIAQGLQEAGIAVWMDCLGGIEGGDNWVLALQNGVDEATAMLIVLTPEYTTSKYCQRELTRADSRGIPLFPIMLEPLGNTPLPIQLQDTQYIKFTYHNDPTAFSSAMNELIDRVKGVVPLQDGIQVSSVVENELTRLRSVETDIQQTAQQAKRVSGLRAKRLQRELDNLLESYNAVLDESEQNADPDTVVRLKRRLQYLENEEIRLQQELNSVI